MSHITQELCNHFLNVVIPPSIDDKYFAAFQELCASEDGMKNFLAIENKSKIINTLIALLNNESKSYKELAVKILSQPNAVYDLDYFHCQKLGKILTGPTITAQQKTDIFCAENAVQGLGLGESLMAYLEGNAFTSQQKVQMLCAKNVVPEIISELNKYRVSQVDRLTDLLRGDTFTTEENFKILSSPRFFYRMANSGFGGHMLTILENKPFSPEQKTQILNAEFASDGFEYLNQHNTWRLNNILTSLNMPTVDFVPKCTCGKTYKRSSFDYV